MSVFTAANQLTLLRLLLAPVLAIFMLYGLPGWALLTFTVAAVTDAFDGVLARRGQPTTLGAWLDPMADKILVLTLFVMLTLPGLGMTVRLPVWLTVLVVSRDIGIVLTVAIFNLAVARRTFRPTFLGKASTVVFLATGVVTLYANYLGERIALVDLGVYASLTATLLSAGQYLVRMTRRVEESGRL
jgi:cardiolipin synthase